MRFSIPEGFEVLAFTALGFQFLRRFLDTPTRLPAWEPYLKRVWLIAVVLYGVGALLGIDTFATGWYWLAVSVLVAYLLLQIKDYPPARTILLALAPILIATTVEELVEDFSPAFHKSNDDYFQSASAFASMWLIAFLVIANRQKKALVKREQEREHEAEQRRIIEARKAELEELVAERTALITHQKEELEQALAELKATQSQLIQSEKMASLGELTAGIAHEIQNPLNFVNNFSEVSIELLDELAQEQAKPARDPDLEAELLTDLKQNLEKISHHGGRASSIVRGMLQHSRASSGQREPTDLNALADEYLRLAYHGLRAKDKTFNAKLNTDFDVSLGQVSLVPQDMGRVLLNLFTNAFYAVQQRQKQSPPDYQPTVSVQTSCESGQVRIVVSDNGTGIPNEVKEKVFQPFFTTKPTGQGTGLGLSLAYDIVTKGHNGSLAVESTEGQGTTFIIQLPA
ncbi:ATP-binding protein [Spirosoma soli]|uniref:histidine kinase n=1 Tax=Spirosoma soli TaxID=1770529 RepID=A0ABW5M7G7_9BACT